MWASPDGALWYWVAGSSNGYTHPRYPTTFVASVDVCHCQDAAYNQYRMGGYRGNVMYNDGQRSDPLRLQRPVASAAALTRAALPSSAAALLSVEEQ